MANTKKALTKAITWRIISTGTSFMLAWAFFGSLTYAGWYALVDAIIKFALYYGHEIGWQGRLKAPPF
jgi:uncharacterized membrane protein